MGRAASLLLALLLAASGHVAAQAPAPQPATSPAPGRVAPIALITAPPSVPAGAPLILTAERSTSRGPVAWSLIAPKGPFEVWSRPGSPDGMLLIRNPVPGATYKFALVATGDEPAFAFDFADVAVAPTGPVPPPGPGPEPAPPTPPVPPPVPAGYAGHVHATLVFDLDDPSTAQLRASPVKDDLKALDASWYTAPTAGTVCRRFAHHTAVDGLPIVYFTDPKGNVLDRLKSPRAEAEVLAMLRKIRGDHR